MLEVVIGAGLMYVGIVTGFYINSKVPSKSAQGVQGMMGPKGDRA